MAHRLPQHAGHNSLSLTASITLGEYRLKQAGMLLFPSTLPPQDDTRNNPPPSQLQRRSLDGTETLGKPLLLISAKVEGSMSSRSLHRSSPLDRGQPVLFERFRWLEQHPDSGK